MSTNRRFVIVGGGLAGAKIAEACVTEISTVRSPY